MKNPIESTSKKDQKIALARATWAFEHPISLEYDIFDAYERPSVYKVRAWERCKALCERLNGWGLAIASHNCMTFTAVFQFADPDTGELSLAYITKDYDRFCHAS